MHRADMAAAPGPGTPPGWRHHETFFHGRQASEMGALPAFVPLAAAISRAARRGGAPRPWVRTGVIVRARAAENLGSGVACPVRCESHRICSVTHGATAVLGGTP